MLESEKIIVGKILNTKGLKGTLKVKNLSDNPNRFDKGNFIFIEGVNKEKKIINSYNFKGFYYIDFEGIDTLSKAEIFKSKYLYVEKKDLRDLSDEEYYIFDVINLPCFYKNKSVGYIKDVLTDYPNEVFVLDTNGVEVLVPSIKHFVKEIDLNNKIVKLDNLEDLYE